MFKSKFGGLASRTKEAEREHYSFLNQMQAKFNIDQEKLISLEARISCKLHLIFILNRGWNDWNLILKHEGLISKIEHLLNREAKVFNWICIEQALIIYWWLTNF